VPRAASFTGGLSELTPNGGVRLPLDEAAVRALVPKLRAQNVNSFAIALPPLGYANATHERRAAEILRAEMEDVRVTLVSGSVPRNSRYETSDGRSPTPMFTLDRRLPRPNGRSAVKPRSSAARVYLVTSAARPRRSTGAALSRFVFSSRSPRAAPSSQAILPHLGGAGAVLLTMGGHHRQTCLIENYQPELALVFEVDRAARFS